MMTVPIRIVLAEDLTRQVLTFSRKQVVQPALLDQNEMLSELEGSHS